MLNLNQEVLSQVVEQACIDAAAHGRWLVAISRALGGLEDAVALKGWAAEMEPHFDVAREHDDALAHQGEMLVAGRMLEMAGPPDAEPDEPGSTEPEDAVA